MRRNRVGIEVAYDRIDAVLMRGDRVIAAHRIPITPTTDHATWIATLSGAQDQLRRFIEHAGAGRLPAQVLYRSPSQVVDFPHFQLATADEACDAAALSCGGALSQPHNSIVCESCVMAQDTCNGQRRWHVAVVADRNDIVQSVATFVSGAGLRFEGALALDGAIALGMAEAASRAVHEPPRGWLHLGTHSSFFLVRSGGVIRFLRRINLGLETIAASLTRPIHQTGRAQPVELSLDAARRLLFENGVPARTQLVHQQLRLHGSDVLPLMQPSLQRLLVELRQSLRFGMDEKERSELSVSMHGPGCALPRFVELLAGELGVRTHETFDGGDVSPFQAGSSSSELVQCMAAAVSFRRLRMLPLQLVARQQSRQAQRCMWAGAAAAVALLASQWTFVRRDLDPARQRLRSLESTISDVESLTAARDRVMTALASMGEVEHLIRNEVGTSVDLRALMHELTIITPESIRITSIDVMRDADVLAGSIIGYALRPGADGEDRGLQRFMDDLKRSPLFHSVVLRDVRKTVLEEDEVLRFSASFEPVAVPETSIIPAPEIASVGASLEAPP